MARDTDGGSAGTSHQRSWLALGTITQVQVVTSAAADNWEEACTSAAAAMAAVERACSRFDANSELMHLLCSPIGTPVHVSPILFQAVRFAVEVADWTDGQFDPTVGGKLQELGFVHSYLTGEKVDVPLQPDANATYRDVELSESEQTICLHRPLVLDLGAVAKGLAIDLAVEELKRFSFPGFVVDAGGDVYVAGHDPFDQQWVVGIRHPMRRTELIRRLSLTDAAVCTSGTYERTSPILPHAHHLIDIENNRSVTGILSLTAVGPYAMMTDALSTAAFVSGPAKALGLLEQAGLDGMFFTEDLSCHTTPQMERYML